MGLRVSGLAVDCRDAGRLAEFWCEALGYEMGPPEEYGISIFSGDGSGPGIDLVVVGEDKVVKNRLHLDLRPDDQDAEVERLLGLGARRLDVGQGDDGTWVVLADPEGNEFCILSAEDGAG
ncbi:MAG: VOC family protein [Acidimicrobiia bacterium]